MSNRDTAATVDYHEATKHSEQSTRASRHVLDWENQPLSFKIYRDLEAIPLSRGFPVNDLPALQAIAPPVAAAAAEAEGERMPDLATLARVLDLSAGITKRRRYPGGETTFRAYPNTGALHHSITSAPTTSPCGDCARATIAPSSSKRRGRTPTSPALRW
jgi:hypothetical protein